MNSKFFILYFFIVDPPMRKMGLLFRLVYFLQMPKTVVESLLKKIKIVITL